MKSFLQFVGFIAFMALLIVGGNLLKSGDGGDFMAGVGVIVLTIVTFGTIAKATNGADGPPSRVSSLAPSDTRHEEPEVQHEHESPEFNGEIQYDQEGVLVLGDRNQPLTLGPESSPEDWQEFHRWYKRYLKHLDERKKLGKSG